MANNINRVPSGLLSLLDTQTQGQAPDEFVRTVQGTLSLSDYYYINKGREQVFLQGVPIAAFPGSSDPITVPEGELWVVHQMFCTAVPLEVVNIIISLVIRPNANSFLQTVASSPRINAPLFPQQLRLGVTFATPFFLSAGNQIMLNVDSSLTAPVLGITPEVGAWITRLQI